MFVYGDEVSTLAQELAAWTAELDFERLPGAWVETVEACLCDYVRAVALGSATPWGRRIYRAAMASTGGGPCHVHVLGDMVDPRTAALINGCFAHASDIDDTHVGGMIHPGAVVIPAVMSVGERLGSDGRSILAAMFVGYEVCIRISEAVQPGHFKRGFQATGTVGVFGATAAAAKLMGLPAGAIAGAFGLAGSLSGGLAQFYFSGSEVKRLHAGRASEGGVLAAMLAAEGLYGPVDVLEGEAGFGQAMGSGIDRDVLLGGLGRTSKVEEVTFKVHATSARIQASVRATLDVVAEGHIKPSTIAGIEVAIPGIVEGRLTQKNPPDCSAAQLSLPFSVALAAVLADERGAGATLGVTDYLAALDDERVRRLAGVTVCRRDTEIERLSNAESVGSRVAIICADGRRMSRLVEAPPGSPRSPISRDGHDRLVDSALRDHVGFSAARSKEVVSEVRNMRDAKNVASFAEKFMVADAQKN